MNLPDLKNVSIEKFTDRLVLELTILGQSEVVINKLTEKLREDLTTVLTRYESILTYYEQYVKENTFKPLLDKMSFYAFKGTIINLSPVEGLAACLYMVKGSKTSVKDKHRTFSLREFGRSRKIAAEEKTEMILLRSDLDRVISSFMFLMPYTSNRFTGDIEIEYFYGYELVNHQAVANNADKDDLLSHIVFIHTKLTEFGNDIIRIQKEITENVVLQ